MKYVVLIYSNPATWRSLPAEEAERVIKVDNDLMDELTASGEIAAVLTPHATVEVRALMDAAGMEM